MKLLLTTILVALTLNLYSQSNMTVSNETTPLQLVNSEETPEMEAETDETIIKINHLLPDGIMLNGTKMVIVKKGVMRELTKEITLSNGTRVTPGGFIFRKNKPKLLLNYGEYIDPSGKIIPMENINSITN